MNTRNLIASVLAASALLGCAAATSPSTSRSPGLGEIKETAIEVCKPPGERAYLDRLQCPDGSVPVYRRVGSFGSRSKLPDNLTDDQASALFQHVMSGAPLKQGEPDYHVIDGYELSCGSAKRMVYMDMYHCHQAPPMEAPDGFQSRKPG